MEDNAAEAHGGSGVSANASVGTGVFGVADADGEVRVWDPVGLEPLGLPLGDVIGRSFLELLAPPVPDEIAESWARRAPWSGLVPLLGPDGRRTPALVRLRPLTARAGDLSWLIHVTAAEPAAAESRNPTESALLKQWALEQLPLPMAVFDRSGVRVAVNAAMESMLGRPEACQCVAQADLEAIDEATRRAVRTGETVVFETRSQRPGDARAGAWMLSVYPLKDSSGHIRGAALAAVDTTEHHAARRRLDLLNEAGGRIGRTLDLARTADELAEVATEHFADFIVVDILDSVLSGEEARRGRHGELLVFRRVAQRSVLPGCPESVVALGALHTYHENSPTGQALAEGRALLDRVSAASTRQWGAGGPERSDMIRKFGIHSVLTVPLRARGLTLGLANFIRHRTEERFNDEDLRLAEDLASRAAVCVDNARRYARERATALALQRTLLPEQASHQARSSVEVASRYLPAEPEIGIGGDWFDVIPLAGARVALVVGDVVGHGVQASATMGRLCTAVRTLADIDLAPDELLTQLDDLVLRLDRDASEPGTHAFEAGLAEVGATCLYAVYDPVTRRCSIARAGHPVPVLIKPNGAAEFLDVPAGPPLGLGGLPFEVAEFELPERSVLALYTDGLVDGSDRDAQTERAIFQQALADAGTSLDDACDALVRRLPPRHRTDDAALLLARTKALAADRIATWQCGADPATVAQARKWVVQALASWNLDAVAYAAELVACELVTNALRYGTPPIHLRLLLPESAGPADGALICEVGDASSTAPHLRRARTFDEGGRGLLIVAQLSRRWGCRQTPAGKIIWAEIPLSA